MYGHPFDVIVMEAHYQVNELMYDVVDCLKMAAACCGQPSFSDFLCATMS